MAEENQATKIIAYLKKHQAVAKEFGKIFETEYPIAGKTAVEWRSHFTIKFPPNPDPAQCKALAAKLAAKYQEANFLFAMTEAQLDVLQEEASNQFSSSFNQLILTYKESGKKQPGVEVLKHHTKGMTADIDGTTVNVRIVKMFWKRILDGLSEVRKHIEQATINNGIIAKQDAFLNTNIPYTPKGKTFGKKEVEDVKKTNPSEWS
jgi:hypothetical protein